MWYKILLCSPGTWVSLGVFVLHHRATRVQDCQRRDFKKQQQQVKTRNKNFFDRIRDTYDKREHANSHLRRNECDATTLTFLLSFDDLKHVSMCFLLAAVLELCPRDLNKTQGISCHGPNHGRMCTSGTNSPGQCHSFRGLQFLRVSQTFLFGCTLFGGTSKVQLNNRPIKFDNTEKTLYWGK
jgi:hypothetical protein